MNRALWKHQIDALEALRQSIGQGVRRIVLSAPTGSGKTVLAAAIIEGALRKGNRVAFVVSNLSLVDQTVEAFYAEGIRDVGVLQANHPLTDWSKPVTICSIQTLKSREAYPRANVVIIDETHVLHEFQKVWLMHPDWQKAVFIGLSATPYTKGLGKYFQSMIVVSTTKELIEAGVLSPFVVYATGHPDLRGVKIVAGDYHEGELSTVMQDKELTANIIQTWLAKWGKDKTLFFGVDCAHAQAVQQRFIDAGISCGYQDAHTPADERREIKRKFHNGEYRVVSNVSTLTTGTDWDCRCLILARPTRSLMLFQQIVGRGLRTAPGKDKLVLLDHSDTTQRLGFVTDIYCDQLDDGKSKPKKSKADDGEAPLPKECKSCHALRPPGRGPCPHCGQKPEISSEWVERDGELIEIKPGEIRKPSTEKHQYTREEKSRLLSELRWYARQHGYSYGWCSHKFREKTGVWPRGLDSVPMIEPSVETLSFIKARQIAWAKSKQKQAAREAVNA